MGKNLKVDRYNDKPASDSAPGNIKTLPVSPIREIKGPSIKSDPQGPKGAPYLDKGEAQSS